MGIPSHGTRRHISPDCMQSHEAAPHRPIEHGLATNLAVTRWFLMARPIVLRVAVNNCREVIGALKCTGRSRVRFTDATVPTTFTLVRWRADSPRAVRSALRRPGRHRKPPPDSAAPGRQPDGQTHGHAGNDRGGRFRPSGSGPPRWSRRARGRGRRPREVLATDSAAVQERQRANYADCRYSVAQFKMCRHIAPN